MLDIRSIPRNDAFLVAKLQTVTATCKVSIMQVASYSFPKFCFTFGVSSGSYPAHGEDS